jgi:microcystin-dependent protein
MAQPYVGEIRMFAGNFAPAGWMFCEGQLVPISEYETLFNLIGTTYGGDGQSTFAMPDMRGRLPLHQGNGFVLAETGGVEEVTLNVSQIPSHTHYVVARTPTGSAPNGNATHTTPGGNMLASGTIKAYSSSVPGAMLAMNAAVVTSVGGSQPHENKMPYLCVNYIISLFGIYPSET